MPVTRKKKKFAISKKHLIPKQIGENGLKKENIEFVDEGVRAVVSEYTREAGLRHLERAIATLCRKTARFVAEGKTGKTTINEKQVHKFLGPAIYTREDEQEKDEIGIATGLAWTSVGGEILYVESTSMKGKGGIILTGQLGDVMKESVQAAMGLIRWRALDFNIDEDIFANTDIHVHFPAGGVPKDGPSAGITVCTAIISRLTGIPVKKDVAMTGEVTITGRVLPIGGLKEKALAAMRHGIKTIIIPDKNVKDLDDIPAEYRKNLKFVPVKAIDDVLDVVLTKKISKKAKGSSNSGSSKKSPKAKGRKIAASGSAMAAKGRH